MNGKYVELLKDKIGYNILLKYGLVEMVFFIFKDGKCIDGGPVSWMFLNEESDRFIHYRDFVHTKN